MSFARSCLNSIYAIIRFPSVSYVVEKVGIGDTDGRAKHDRPLLAKTDIHKQQN